MARVQSPASGFRVLLAARHLFGRSSACHSQLSSSKTSGVHAELWWGGTSWMIQDLGSRNGTFVDGRRLGAGEEVDLADGAALAFGDRRAVWKVLDLEPPRLLAIDAAGELVLGDGALLCLPAPNAIEATVYQDLRGRWVVEDEAGVAPINDLGLVEVGGRSWRVYLPSAIVPTELETMAGQRRSLDEVGLVFTVSRDLEYIELGWTDGVTTRWLQAQAHGLLLLTLARARLDDARDVSLPEVEHGWRYREDLLGQHKIDAALLNLWIHRARKQLANAGLAGAGQIIQRRAMSRQLRIGTGTIDIIQH
jgi:hypothetical protein